MSNTISILIVDDNKELCEILYESINNTGDMRVLATVGDGKAAMDLIRELQPDVVLLDIIMPRLDGRGVLESITSMQGIKRPSIIVITSVGAESVVIRAMELGADYYIMKPFEIGMLITRIRQIYSEREAYDSYLARLSDYRESDSAHTASSGPIRPDTNNAARIVTELVNCIGVTPNLAGYIYLREAVLYGMEQPERLENISGNIYTLLAQKYNTKVRNVDRAIRCALLSAQKKTKNADSLNEDMKETFTLNNGRQPNNSQIINFLVKKASKRLMDARYRQFG